MGDDRAGLEAIRAGLARRAAQIVKSDPERAALAVELGLVDRAWLEDPANQTLSSAAPREVLARFLERSVEQKPSVIGQLGLNALSLMALGDDEPGETRPTTITFTDLEGFTAFTDAEGDAAALELLDAHHKRVGPVVRGRGGRTVKRLGDGLLLAFPSPDAALLAALELQDLDHGTLRLRVGVHHGEVVITADDLLGHDVNVAARVADAAEGGQVLATDAAVRAVEDLDALGLALVDTDTRRFKGLSTPTVVHRVVRRG